MSRGIPPLRAGLTTPEKAAAAAREWKDPADGVIQGCAYRGALQTAWVRGVMDFHAGADRRENPYPDHRTPARGIITFSRAFRTAWLRGFDEADEYVSRVRNQH